MTPRYEMLKQLDVEITDSCHVDFTLFFILLGVCYLAVMAALVVRILIQSGRIRWGSVTPRPDSEAEIVKVRKRRRG